MNQVIIYTTTYCPYCQRAKNLLDSLGISYQEINLTGNDKLREEVIKKYQWQTVPIIVINDHLIGGADDLQKLHQNNELQKMLQK